MKLNKTKNNRTFVEPVLNRPYVDDTGIWMPIRPGIYHEVMTKELFIEAYNKWIIGTAEENSAKSNSTEHCIVCGEVIPEGRQVCTKCEIS